MLELIGVGLPSLPKFASKRRRRASRFSLELNSWSIKSSSTLLLRVRRCFMNNAENLGSLSIVSSMADFAIAVIRHDFDLAFLQIVDGVSHVALGEDDLTFSIFGNCFSRSHDGQKHLGIEGLFSCLCHAMSSLFDA